MKSEEMKENLEGDITPETLDNLMRRDTKMYELEQIIQKKIKSLETKLNKIKGDLEEILDDCEMR